MGCEGFGPRTDPRRGCPDCEYTIRRKRFEEKTLKAIHNNRAAGGKAADAQWPLEILSRNLGLASRAAAQRKTGYDRKWSVTLCRLVDIYRDEVARMRATDSYNLTQEGKSRGNGGSSKSRLPPTRRDPTREVIRFNDSDEE